MREATWHKGSNMVQGKQYSRRGTTWHEGSNMARRNMAQGKQHGMHAPAAAARALRTRHEVSIWVLPVAVRVSVFVQSCRKAYASACAWMRMRAYTCT
eukprot:scaffold68843_cov24-Tisochrysis_lutea.AAC.1